LPGFLGTFQYFPHQPIPTEIIPLDQLSIASIQRGGILF